MVDADFAAFFKRTPSPALVGFAARGWIAAMAIGCGGGCMAALGFVAGAVGAAGTGCAEVRCVTVVGGVMAFWVAPGRCAATQKASGFGGVATGAAGLDCAAVALAGWLCGSGRLSVGAGTVVAAACGARARISHQPKPPANRRKNATTINGSRPRRGRDAANGVPRSGASPRRRLASDFFRASRISDMRHCSQLCHSTLRKRCGPDSSSADSANRVSGPTMPSGLMP